MIRGGGRRGTVVAGEPTAEGALLQPFFSTFPARWPGIGLLLLRAAVGLSAVAEGQSMLRAAAGLAAGGVGMLLLAAGLSLLAGFLTPVVAMAVALSGAGIGLDVIPAIALSVLDDGLAIALVIAMSLAIVLLGPGAYSLDSYFFGRREIVIRRSRTSDC